MQELPGGWIWCNILRMISLMGRTLLGALDHYVLGYLGSGNLFYREPHGGRQNVLAGLVPMYYRAISSKNKSQKTVCPPFPSLSCLTPVMSSCT